MARTERGNDKIIKIVTGATDRLAPVECRQAPRGVSKNPPARRRQDPAVALEPLPRIFSVGSRIAWHHLGWANTGAVEIPRRLAVASTASGLVRSHRPSPTGPSRAILWRGCHPMKPIIRLWGNRGLGSLDVSKMTKVSGTSITSPLFQ